jgi:NAD(P)-dependent dehydrogenase (short-subunit alcohol dehydrogenase family)
MDMRRFFNPDLLAGMVAVITGGGTGIGLIAARALGQVGATIVIAARNQDRLRTASRTLAAGGIRCAWKELNIRDPEMVDHVLDGVVREQGRLDILVNNAGGQFLAPAEQISANGWRAVIDLNLNGTFHCCKAAARHMIAQGGGKILNIIISFTDRSTAGMAHSGAARAGVAHMTRTLAHEWAPYRINVNALGPQVLTEAAMQAYGPAGTDHIARATPLARWATDDEAGAWIVTLCSPIAGYTTGAVVPLDGGNAIGGGLTLRGGASPA